MATASARHAPNRDQKIREHAVGLSHLTLPKIKTLLAKAPPDSLDPSKGPTNRSQKDALDALVALGCSYALRHDSLLVPISSFLPSVWSSACAWGFIFMRDIVLSDIAEGSLKDKIICAMGGLFSKIVEIGSISVHNQVFASIPHFLDVSLEILVQLLAADHLAFQHWSHFHFVFCDVIKGLKTRNAREYQRISDRLAPKYDIPGLCIRRFNEEVFDGDMSSQGFHTVMMCWMTFSQSSETVFRAILSKGGISCVVNGIHRFVRLSIGKKRPRWDDNLYYLQVANSIVDCEDILLTMLTRGQSWVIEALDCQLLTVLAKVPPSLDGKWANIPIGRQTVAIVECIMPFVIYRGVLNRVIRAKIRMDIMGGNIGIEAVQDAIQKLLNYAAETKEAYRVFEKITPSLSTHCSNTNCQNCYDTPLEPVRLKRCYGCHLALYCSSGCQKAHWRNSHRKKCASSPRPKRDGISYGMSDFDIAFMRYLIRRRAPDWTQKLLVHSQRKPGQAFIISATLSEAPMTINTGISRERLEGSLPNDGRRTLKAIMGSISDFRKECVLHCVLPESSGAKHFFDVMDINEPSVEFSVSFNSRTNRPT
ncbi:hypothetical protein V5O48_008711 [Marasmius crinis-equi]|uniref:MYND-type domain-containing protein n=1 Tax=Marasmius crinis-equi TaxID=585013 RepID=A0ABR3FDT1_9AGAR